MKKCNAILMGLVIGSMTLLGAAGIASARGGCGGYGGHGGYGYHAMQDLSPEVRESLRKAHEAMAPVFMQYQAKRAELTAKIYSGADDKTIQDLSKEVERLHTQILEGRVNIQKQLSKAGVPLRGFRGGMWGCPGFMDGGHGPGDCYGWDRNGRGGPDRGGHGWGRRGHGPRGGHGHMGEYGPMDGGRMMPDQPGADAPAKPQK